VDEPSEPEVPEGIKLRDPVAWFYLPRPVRRAWYFFAAAFVTFFIGFPALFLGQPEWRWLGWVLIPLGAAGLVAVGLHVQKWWNDPAPLVRSSARRMILVGAGLVVVTPLWYWLMVIPRL
jgi:hypothetical protein